MADGNFETCLAITDRWEGGYVDHPADPGGKTNRGITQATYDHWRRRWGLPVRSVRQVTSAERVRIYREGYWNAVKGDALAPGVDLATFDAGVNSGPSRAVSWLMKAIGGPDHVTVKKLCAIRLSFVRGLSTWKTFGRGWTNRIADIEARGVKMALATKLEPAAVAGALEDEATKADSTAVKQTAGGATAGSGTAAGGVGVDQIDMANQFAGWIMIGVLVAGVALAVFLIWRARVNRARADAYSRVAQEG